MEILYIPANTNMPLANTDDEVQVEEVDVEYEAETDEEKLDVDEEATYVVLKKLGKAMIDSVMQISLKNTTMARSSSSNTRGTDAQDKIVASGTYSSTYGATVFTRPLFTVLSVVFIDFLVFCCI